MKTFHTPVRESIAVSDSRVITFGLSEEQNKLVEKALPMKDYELLATDVPTDLIAIPTEALIINAAALEANGKDIFFEYYKEIGSCFDETMFWFGYPKPPGYLQTKFKFYENFDDFLANLKYHLLSAHSKSRKAKDFSRKLADCLMVLSLIRSCPGIKTKEIVDKLEMSTRTVQRYIATLQAAGEWIEYDYKKKGWYLQYGISVLFGDCKTERETMQ